jgi:hypothetical protein
VKAAGDHWIVQEKKGRKVFSKGVWAPAATIERIRADLEAERSTEGYAKKKEATPAAVSRPRLITSRTSTERSWCSWPSIQPMPLSPTASPVP